MSQNVCQVLRVIKPQHLYPFSGPWYQLFCWDPWVLGPVGFRWWQLCFEKAHGRNMGQNPSLLEKINVDTDIHRLYGPLMGFEIMTTWNLPKTWPVSDAALYSEHLQLRHLANGDAGASCNGTYAPWCSKPHGVTEQFRPWRAMAKSCGRLVGFAAGRRLLWCGFTRIWIAQNYIIQKPVMPKQSDHVSSLLICALLSINVLIVFGCVWMIFGEVQPWYHTHPKIL